MNNTPSGAKKHRESTEPESHQTAQNMFSLPEIVGHGVKLSVIYLRIPFRMNCIGFNGATQILLLSYSVKGATILLIIHNERRLSHLPGTTTIIPYGVTHFSTKRFSHCTGFSLPLLLLKYAVITMFTENSFLYQILTWI